MLHYVIDVAEEIGSDRIILIIGHKKELVRDACRDRKVEFVEQTQQLGTGHAVLQTLPLLSNFTGDVLVLSGDVPLLTAATINRLLAVHRQQDPLASLLTANMEDPTGYGRVVRDINGFVKQIVEHKDANEQILKINEINVGIYIFKSQPLFKTLPLVKNNNSQSEYYLPDVVKMYVDSGKKVAAVVSPNVEETHGINNIDQLSAAEEILKRRVVKHTP